MMRRWLLLLALAGAVLSTAGCRASAASRAGEPFTFVQISDPQVGMYRAFKEVDDYAPEQRDFPRAVQLVRAVAPDFVVITGDLVEQWNDAEQLALFDEFLRELREHTTVYLAAGNHDMPPTTKGLALWRDRFGPDRYAFRHRGSRFLVINSNLIAFADRLPEEEQAQWDWLERELEQARQSGARHVVLFHHHPYFLREANEEDGYFNVPLARRKRYLALLDEHGVDAVFTGHYHQEAGGRANGTEFVVTSSLGKPLGEAPAGLRIVVVGGEGITHEYVPLP